MSASSSGPLAPAWSAWSLSLYPDAGEAGGCFWRPPSGRKPSGADPERARAEAARRARSKVRRYCAANRLNRLGTLTYAGEGYHDPRALRADLGGFFRALRSSLGGETFPYVWALEWHKSGHGLHAHFAVGRFIGRRKIEQAWGRGFVHIKLLGGLPVGSTSLDEARLAARYLSKYVGKDFDVDRADGLHRYEVAQGFQPAVERIRGRSSHEVLQASAALMRGWPDEVYRSEDVDGYVGPPWVWASWLTREQVRAWVEKSCAEQGVPVLVDDPGTLAQVVVLLTGQATRPAGRGSGPSAA